MTPVIFRVLVQSDLSNLPLTRTLNVPRILLTVTIIVWVFKYFDYNRLLQSVTNLAVRFRTRSSSSWLHLGVLNRTALLHDSTHLSFIRCSFNAVMNSRTYWSIISFQGEIGMEANNFANCLPERGHNWIIKRIILFYLLSDARLVCQQSSLLLPLKLARYNTRIWCVMSTTPAYAARQSDPQ